ncbi:hypothetical protein [Pseudomonas sp. E102]|uniref:hypothetical protein n=1 Tax=Pseudomonas sp. E102 TaxID=181579 RepID=UPI00404665EB
MPWERSDKKRYSGKIEGIFASITEAWDVEDFIDQYLVLRGFQVNDMNRERIALRLEAAPGRPPYRAVQLVAWLDENYTAGVPASSERSEADARTSHGQPASTTPAEVSDRCRFQPRSVTDFDTISAGAKLNHMELPSATFPAPVNQVAEPMASSTESSVTSEIYKPFGDGQRDTGTNEPPQFAHCRSKSHRDSV